MLHDFNGAFLINKEKGFTSHDIVFKLRKILKLKQIGHTGTLDPMATGLLICLVGPSVRLLPYLGAENKKYSLELELGKTTDSWDITGQVLSVAKIEKLKEESLMSEINAMQGGLMIPIPMYSAKKVDGLKLYEIARKNQSELTQPVDQDFEGPIKEMKFWGLENIQIELPFVRLSLDCSKGSFIRSWAYELGKRLHLGATLSQLCRLGIDEFKLSQAQSLEEIASDLKAGNTPKCYLPQNVLINRFDQLELEEGDYKKIENGLLSYHLVEVLQKKITTPKCGGDGGSFLFCTYQKKLAAIIEMTQEPRLKKVFRVT